MIWIDDHFNDSAELLGDMLANNVETTLACNIPELADALKLRDIDEAAMRDAIKQALLDVSQERRDEIRAAYFAVEQRKEHAPTREMSAREVKEACELLNIAPDDRWPFAGVETRIRDVCQEGDADVSYIVDLKDSREAGAADKSGLRVLRLLAAENSKGTAFILTHETTTNEEANFEQELLAQIARDNHPPVPLCVISKQRLSGSTVEVGMEEAFRVAIKRAGLRRSIHEVVKVAESKIASSFAEARTRLLRIAPERLDDHVVEWGQVEGVSELHVIERAITAHMARDIRTTFAGSEVLDSVERLRSLREIPLKRSPEHADPDLVSFRDAETWEPAELINGSFSALACGDVFEVELSDDKEAGGEPLRFVLLVQPCDVQLRRQGNRSVRTGVLAPLTKSGGDQSAADRIKQYELPCSIDGKNWTCDLRDATNVDLHILDLASFRTDGRVRYDSGQPMPRALLPGQKAMFPKRTNWLAQYISDQSEAPVDIENGGLSQSEAGTDALADTTGTRGLPFNSSEQTSETSEPRNVSAGVTAEESVRAALVEGPADLDEVVRRRQRKKAEKAARKAAGRAAADADSTNILLARIRSLEAASSLIRRLQLAFAAPDVFRPIEAGSYLLQQREPTADMAPEPPHISWNLRRSGRIRMPFATDILDRYVKVMNRTAFDPDFVESPRENFTLVDNNRLVEGDDGAI